MFFRTLDELCAGVYYRFAPVRTQRCSFLPVGGIIFPRGQHPHVRNVNGPLVLGGDRCVHELLLGRTFVAHIHSSENDTAQFRPKLVRKLVLFAPVREQLLLHYVIHEGVYSLVLQVLVGLSKAQYAVPGDLVQQGHIHPVCSADHLVGHDQVAQDDGLLPQTATYFARELLDLHHCIGLSLERARVDLPVVSLATLRLAALVGHPELAGSGVKQHFEDLCLHFGVGVLSKQFAVLGTYSYSYVALVGG